MITVVSTMDERGSPPLLTKIIRRSKGEWVKSNYDNAYHFGARTHDVDNIHALSTWLSVLEDMPDHALVRGRVVEGRDPFCIRRTLHTSTNQEGNFEPVPGGLPWVMLDIDKLPVASLGLTTNEERLAHVISILPPEFQDATFHYQWSSSAGLDGWQTLSAHLWFWLDEPWPCRTLYERIEYGDWRDFDIDPAPFTVNQLHYTAAPIFDGIDDPLGTIRSGLIQGARDEVTLTPWVREVPAPQTFTAEEREQRFPGAGFEELLAEIGPNYHRPILRAVAHYIAVTQRPDIFWLADRVREAIWQAAPGRNRKEDYADARYLDRVIHGALRKFGRGF